MSELLSDKTVSDFLAQLGSDAPTPGGGGASALAGANAAGLVTMVARLTISKEAFAIHAPRIQEIINAGDKARIVLEKAIDADAEAFEAVMSGYRLPRATPEEKAARAVRIQEGLKIATESPLNIARYSAEMAELAAELAEIGNPQAISDAGTAALLAEAAVQGALLQGCINLKSLKDGDYVAAARAEIEQLIERASNARSRALATTLQKLA
ncbi:MAG: cyclodeaminase/cyclohydrolase family protein [Chloroflexi bacterium]|uniref:Cyclodeaminase/cyclohydrolase family protein n=1 Tax=Candidatus Chlorohelix allophototropha TaxID=3003348 RepID=A0A8T7M1M3_9CHLR|nr:cyclodeaminase/cyclohydrolase family protein [Chloroflexota bacterium]WJW67919.1 cyclodeaminase/cyclohydrolase family protein [Chloroflexota bacterium L227-S17]